VDNRTYHRYPDHEFADAKEKGDDTPTLNRHDDSDRPEGHVGNASYKNEQTRNKGIQVYHIISLKIKGTLANVKEIIIIASNIWYRRPIGFNPMASSAKQRPCHQAGDFALDGLVSCHFPVIYRKQTDTVYSKRE
jgi:hypothetical protein